MAWASQVASLDPAGKTSVVPSPFGLIRVWEDGGQIFIAETSSDGALLGQSYALGASEGGAHAASAAVHRLDASFFLTVTWVSGRDAGASDVLSKSWELGRGAQGLVLTAANDNPVVIARGASDAAATPLPATTCFSPGSKAARGTLSARSATCRTARRGSPPCWGRPIRT